MDSYTLIYLAVLVALPAFAGICIEARSFSTWHYGHMTHLLVLLMAVSLCCYSLYRIVAWLQKEVVIPFLYPLVSFIISGTLALLSVLYLPLAMIFSSLVWLHKKVAIPFLYPLVSCITSLILALVHTLWIPLVIIPSFFAAQLFGTCLALKFPSRSIKQNLPSIENKRSIATFRALFRLKQQVKSIASATFSLAISFLSSLSILATLIIAYLVTLVISTPSHLINFTAITTIALDGREDIAKADLQGINTAQDNETHSLAHMHLDMAQWSEPRQFTEWYSEESWDAKYNASDKMHEQKRQEELQRRQDEHNYRVRQYYRDLPAEQSAMHEQSAQQPQVHEDVVILHDRQVRQAQMERILQAHIALQRQETQDWCQRLVNAQKVRILQSHVGTQRREIQSWCARRVRQVEMIRILQSHVAIQRQEIRNWCIRRIMACRPISVNQWVAEVSQPQNTWSQIPSSFSAPVMAAPSVALAPTLSSTLSFVATGAIRPRPRPRTILQARLDR